ncbi:PIF1-like helicase domain-containing protein [Ditylenchus destructor]|uniref:PIF1-like helicase domain-containing protein n=1 Tax=Ditylenchus destructor TaxID=166010 RepID=A0AAD4MN49_9BILA|nr:PIF1-like helicase domain-containing protein [Ditylenchus destructor]
MICSRSNPMSDRGYKPILLQVCITDLLNLALTFFFMPLYVVAGDYALIYTTGFFNAVFQDAPIFTMLTFRTWFFFYLLSICSPAVQFLYRYLVLCRFQVIPRCPMPPKRFKPQVPMETRSRAKAKNNAEIQPEVDAKRIRKDTRPAPVEDGSALRNDYKGEVPAKPQNLNGEGPCNPPARDKADVPHELYYVGEGPSNPPGRDLFINLSSNANISSVILIDAFENIIALNEITTNNELSYVADPLHEIGTSADIPFVSKSRGRPKGKRSKRMTLRHQNLKDQESHNHRQQIYLEKQTPERREKRLSAQKEYESQRRSIETPVQKEKRLSAQRRRDINTRNRTNEMENLLAKERDPTKDYTFKLGSFDFPCVHCGALHFQNEANLNELKKNKAERSYDDYCSHGKIIYDDSPPFPNVLKSLFLKQHPRATEFIENIRNINASFGFVSINAHVKNLTGHPIPGTLPSYGQLFFLDTNQASDIRANNPLNARVSQELFREIETELRNSNNQLIKSYQMMYEVEKQQNELARRNNIPEKKVTLVFDRKARTRNDLPPAESNEVAAIYVTNSEGEVPRSYVTVYQTSGSISQFSTLSEFLDPMTYPLIYPRGETVDMWTRVEGDLLKLQELKNKSMKSAKAFDVRESLNANDTNDVGLAANTDEISKRVILYSDYQGSIRFYQEEFRRSMIMAKRFGPPDLFITITFGSDNEDLKKAINIELEDGQSIQQQSNFRPDMVARAFELIYADFIELIWKNNDNGEPTFGKIQCYSALTQNQRVDPDEIEFLETLKQLGDGELQDGDEGYFEFPEECLSNDLITDVYGSALATKNYDEMHERVILTPLNKDANEICNQVLEFLEGEDKFYTSMDTLAENNNLSNTERYPTEVLNAIQLNERRLQRASGGLSAITSLPMTGIKEPALYFLSIFQLQYVAKRHFQLLSRKCNFLSNKRAPSSCDNSRSAVGFSSPLLDEANARGTFPGLQSSVELLSSLFSLAALSFNIWMTLGCSLLLHCSFLFTVSIVFILKNKL